MLQRTTNTEPASPQDSTFPSYTKLAAQNKELAAQNKELAAQNALLLEQNHQMREEIQALRDEVARLKKQKPKPKIGPSKMEGKKNKRGNHKDLSKLLGHFYSLSATCESPNIHPLFGSMFNLKSGWPPRRPFTGV